jgi:cytochrome c peroxidase
MKKIKQHATYHVKKITILLFLAGLFSFTRHADPTDAASLGEMLFNDPILSSDQSVHCASCHIPRFAFSDTVAFSKGVAGLGTRNTPSITNMDARPYFFWDGRAKSLEEQE